MERFMAIIERRSGSAGRRHRGVPLLRALLILLVLVLGAALVPAGIVLNQRLAAELRGWVRADLARGLQVVADREAARSDVMMMHAKELAGMPGLSAALVSGANRRAAAMVRSAAELLAEDPILLGPDGAVLVGPPPDSALVARTRRGEMPVAVQLVDGTLRRVALAPVMSHGSWMGAVGTAVPLDATEAGIIAGLTRSTVLFVTPGGDVAASVADGDSAELAALAHRLPLSGGEPVAFTLPGGEYLAAAAPLAGAGHVVLARDLERELAVLPRLRSVAVLIGALALGLAWVAGSVVARRLAHPVRALARAADRLAAGDFEAPVPGAGVREVQQLAEAFTAMRGALAERLEELGAANRALAERQERLSALQAELMQRERLAATGRLVAQLAHEIRNPVANIRNCLELTRRRMSEDAEGLRFVDLATEELLRMHELAEHLLDLNRPRDAAGARCEPAAVAGEVAALALVGAAPVRIEVDGAAPPAAVSPDTLKQVLVNLVQNARDASGESGRVRIHLGTHDGRAVIEVLDDGPGISGEAMNRLFEPFFTTKEGTRSAGLGLFVAEGLVRTAGGRIEAGNRPDAPGARFRVELPAVTASA
jgi:signal transduction histidine kinase